MIRGLPRAFADTASKIMRRKGVVGVFWGEPDAVGGGPPRVRIHVEEKLAPDDLHGNRDFGDSIDGLRVRVIQVGRPRLQAGLVSMMTQVIAPAPHRVSTLAALAARPDGIYGLASGHGALPRDHARPRTVAEGHGEALWVEMRSLLGGQATAAVVAGGFTAHHDWSIVRFDVAPETALDPTLLVDGLVRPPIRTRALPRWTAVRHFSLLDPPRRVTGRVCGTGPVDMTLEDDSVHRFHGALEVVGDAGPFSLECDSGSLVIDGGGEVVGMVAGGSDPARDATPRSYVLPLAALAGPTGAHLDWFFS